MIYKNKGEDMRVCMWLALAIFSTTIFTVANAMTFKEDTKNINAFIKKANDAQKKLATVIASLDSKKDEETKKASDAITTNLTGVCLRLSIDGFEESLAKLDTGTKNKVAKEIMGYFNEFTGKCEKTLAS